MSITRKPNEPTFENIEDQYRWEAENLTNEELIERGWAILGGEEKFSFGCACRKCLYFHGKEKGTCDAYPKGIPDRFAWGAHFHLRCRRIKLEITPTQITLISNSRFQLSYKTFYLY